MTTEHSRTITGQIIGGLALELDKRLPECRVILGSIHGEPAVKVDDFWVVIDQEKLKVVISDDPMAIGGNAVRRVLFSCSIIRPDDDFEGLFEFFRRYDTDFDTGPVPPFRESFAWITARSADNSSK
jgi:hypothetical protein